MVGVQVENSIASSKIDAFALFGLERPLEPPLDSPAEVFNYARARARQADRRTGGHLAAAVGATRHVAIVSGRRTKEERKRCDTFAGLVRARTSRGRESRGQYSNRATLFLAASLLRDTIKLIRG